LSTEVIPVRSEDQRKHINTASGHDVQFCNVKHSGSYSNLRLTFCSLLAWTRR